MKKKNDIISDPAKYRKGWSSGLPETPCGFGSRLNNTKKQRLWIPAMIKKYGITSIADIGAGDLNWIKHMPLECDYYPYDLIPRHPDVEELDLLHDDLPTVDCIMVLWVLNHFPPAQQCHAIERLKNSGSRILIMTWDERMEPCTDLPYSESITLRTTALGKDLDLRLIEL